MSMKTTCLLVVLMLLLLSVGVELQSLLLAVGYFPCMLCAAALSLGATVFIGERNELFCLGASLWAGLFVGFIAGSGVVNVVWEFLFISLQIGCIALALRVNRVVLSH